MGYCTEISRRFMEDLTEEYDIQDYWLDIIKPGISSKKNLNDINEFVSSKEINHKVALYRIGLLTNEYLFKRICHFA